ncbi:MAG: cytochrome b N-terminal domain-containing protein [Alphaproteobacteria bacterium]|jgi:ubiquinol-cytochrome c reductase cytochrome b/c1 subunit|nr:cytochrome b N-terminal domain-containing protein [Alphaproteobacteria bacterium]MBP7729284.1 cytochrome b N-terminal domain-containing protein [Alphaproteobacteria bacterium]
MDRFTKVVRWIDYRLPFFSFIDHELREYPTPRNLNYWWNFGSLAGITLVIMILSGIFLAMHYEPDTKLAFDSVEYIMRNVNYGWLMRYLHANGATMFFIVVYIHMFRGLYYGSYKSPRELLWMLGVVILLLMMATAFMGYVLPWGQMSYWGATVITNLFSVFPFGETIVEWLWGGFSVDNPTLNRFFVLHYLFPFLIVGVVILHLVALHQHGSNNPLGIDRKEPRDSLPFHPYYTVKDLFGLGIFALVWAYFIFFNPNFFGEPDNYIPANPLVTPPHIVPEWYFLPFYAILRSIPNKLLGVIAMFGAVFVLFFLPWLDASKIRSATFRPVYKWIFWGFVVDCFILGCVGAHSPDYIYDNLGGLSNQILGQMTTLLYFGFFFIALPLLGLYEKPNPLPKSLSEPVLKEKKKKKVKTHITLFALSLLSITPLYSTDSPPLPHEIWSFQGPLGTYDRADLQHGFQIYKEVCSVCHSLSQIRFRDLAALGYSLEEVKAIAAEYKVDAIDDEGNSIEKTALPTDKIPGPYKNEQAARAANNGALPPDLSLMTKARAGGADYVYALLTGYELTPPKDIHIAEGMHYNPFFPGEQIAMTPPLSEGLVTYNDGAQPNVNQMAKDVVSFLSWTAEPELEIRKQTGYMVLIYFIVFTILMYFIMRRIWARVK